MPTARIPFTKRKRRYPSTTTASSIHAILLLLACGSPFQLEHHGKITFVGALIAPLLLPARHNDWLSQQQRRNIKKNIFQHSLVLSTTDLMATTSVDVADEPTSTRIKGKSSSPPSTQLKNGKQNKQKSSRKGNYQKKNTSKSRILKTTTPADPWNADYTTSLKTQRKIQSAAADARSRGSTTSDPVDAAHAVLKTLLNAPPTECNAANIVCALTLSSKTLNHRGSGRGGNNNRHDAHQSPPLAEDESSAFQKSLMKTLDILQLLVTHGKLTPRQLCNAAWAIAKHVEYDESLFSRKRDNFVLVKDSSKSYSTWDLREQQMNGDDGTDKLIDEVLNSIALRVVEHLEDTRFHGYAATGGNNSGGKLHKAGGRRNNTRRVQPGELSMLLWAYAVAKPRDCPPGWEQPRRMERLSNNEKEGKSLESDGDDDLDFVTFVEWDDNGASSQSRIESDDNVAAFEKPHESITSRLFDAAAIAFCQGEGAAVKESAKGGERITLLKECTWNELSNIAWSFATRGAYGTKESEAMMTFFAKEATRRIRSCRQSNNSNAREVCNILPRDVIQIAWALGTMESDNISVGDALVHLVDAINEYWIDGSKEEEKDRPLAKWMSADLVQMATALAHGRLDNQSVLSAVYTESLERLHGKFQRKPKSGFSTAEISILMWAQARLYLTPKFGDVYGAFPGEASRALLQRMDCRNNQKRGKLFPAMTMHQKGLGPQEQANLAWSLTILENYDDHVVILLQNIFHAASSNDEGIIQLEHAHQLWQSYFLLSKDCPDAVKFVPEEFSQYLEEKWNIEKSRSKQSSSRHRAISQLLDLMRVAHRNEYDEDVDVAIVLEQDSAWTHTAQKDFDVNNEGHWKVAVEFDGPHHFTVMASTEKDLALMESGVKINPRVLGHTVLKYRLLKKKGWTVVRIPYYEFDKIPVWSSMERQRYLQRALKTHDKIVFSDVDVSEYMPMPSTRHSRFD